MEDHSFIKQEYQADHDYSIVKKEEDIIPKFEENNYPYPSQPSFFDDRITVPWMQDTLGVYPAETKSLQDPTSLIDLQRKYFGKPFIIIKEERIEKLMPKLEYCENLNRIDVKIENLKEEEKANQLSFCKNYVGLLCSGFARTVLSAKSESPISNFIKEALAKRKQKFSSLRNQDDNILADSLRNHIYKTMCGKKIRKPNRERDFKIRNTKELQNLWKTLDKDSELTRLKKETLKEAVQYFFESDHYYEWLANGMITLENRSFFLNNKDEIQKKFQNPGIYKPKFNRNLN